MEIQSNVGIKDCYVSNQNKNESKIDIKSNETNESVVTTIQNLNTNQKNASDTSTLQEKAIIKAIEEANKKFNSMDKGLEFSIHEKTKQIMIKVIDKSNDEVIREIPPEKILDMVATMCEAAGLMLDEKI